MTTGQIERFLGAQFRDFGYLEPTFNAILDSIRFN